MGTEFGTPEDTVRWFGAVQAQDYAGAKWAIAQRTSNTSDADLDHSFNQGRLIRTHVMRPTWHFVAPEDLRWLMTLTAPRIIAASASYYRKFELDQAVFRRSNRALAKALEDGAELTRAEVGQVLERAGIAANGERLGFLVMRAELDQVVCSGPLRGKQFTYASFDRRVPRAKPLSRDESIAELTRRYFVSHGPALLKDFSWWSGLTLADVRAGAEMVDTELECNTVDGNSYWFSPHTNARRVPKTIVHLLPNYDEFLIAYKDHRPSLHSSVIEKSAEADHTLWNHLIVANGLVIGGWKRSVSRDDVAIETKVLVKLNPAERRALGLACARLGEFLGKPVRVKPSAS